MFNIFKKDKENAFKSLPMAIIGILFLVILGRVPSEYYKVALIFLIPFITSPVIFKKIEIKTTEDIKKNYKLILLIFFIQIIVILQIFYLGFVKIPYLPSPINNLFFWGVIITLICSSLWKNKNYNRQKILLILAISWGLITLSQLLWNIDKIKEMI